MPLGIRPNGRPEQGPQLGELKQSVRTLPGAPLEATTAATVAATLQALAALLDQFEPTIKKVGQP